MAGLPRAAMMSMGSRAGAGIRSFGAVSFRDVLFDGVVLWCITWLIVNRIDSIPCEQ